MINKIKASSLIGITGLILCSCSTLPDRTKTAAATPAQEPATIEQNARIARPQANQPEQAVVTPLGKPELVNAFIKKMVTKHHFDEPTLNQLFNSVSMQSKIIDSMNRPAEAMPWHKYRKIFMTEARIDGGLKFWQANSETLRKVEQQTGVPAEIIVSIIGVETQYGSNKGSYRVID
ncbi:lytic murein transglycosylase, partial [Methylicorpusculum sp.]